MALFEDTGRGGSFGNIRFSKSYRGESFISREHWERMISMSIASAAHHQRRTPNEASKWVGVARATQDFSSFLYLHKDPEFPVLAPFLMRKLKLGTLY